MRFEADEKYLDYLVQQKCSTTIFRSRSNEWHTKSIVIKNRFATVNLDSSCIINSRFHGTIENFKAKYKSVHSFSRIKRIYRILWLFVDPKG